MGNQVCALPDGASGKVLRDMAGPQRIPITDRFWFELLKVQLPGIEQAGYFDAHYAQPDVLDGLVRDAYFLQLVATNEHSGNFRTFLRFWARLLHYYRTSPRDAKPCGARAVLSLSLLCRCLLKHFAATFSAPELAFQLEQVPYEPASEAERPPDGSLLVSYRSRRVAVQQPGTGAVGGSCLAGGPAASACLEPLCAVFPEDAHLLRDVEHCAFRAVATGETFAAADVAERAGETEAWELVACPGGVPAGRDSVVRSVFREIIDFLVSSSFGAMSGASPSLLIDSDVEAMEGLPAPRNLSTAPHTLQLQAVLLEILLLLSAVIVPRYAPALGLESAASRADFSAPWLFSDRDRRAAAAAVAARHSAGRAPGSSRGWPSRAAAAASSGHPTTPGRTRAADARPESGGQEVSGPSTRDCAGHQSDSPRLRLHFDKEGAETDPEAPAPCVARPPGPREAPPLLFLSALLQVLDEDEAAEATHRGDSGGTGEEQPHMPSAAPSEEMRCRSGPRAEALLASLLNCVWLEPHAALLPRPPRELLQLLTGVAVPFGRDSPSSRDDAENDLLPATADERAAARAATGAARHLATRALLVLLLLLFHEPEAHPGIGRAFAALTDPLLDGPTGTRPAHTAVAAPLNFTQLLKAVLARLQEGLYPLILYCLVHKNMGFRRYCLCRADADEVLVPILEVLHQLPAVVEGTALAAPPPSATALLLTLLALTGDRGLCEGASRTRLTDGKRVLGHTRPLRDVAVSSLLVIVLLRVAQWNFAACRDPFFLQAVAGVLKNLAAHGVEQLHWYAASRLLEVSQLLARNVLKASLLEDQGAAGDAPVAAEGDQRARMVREFLLALVRFISGCLRVPLAARNGALAYALQRAYPPQFDALEGDPDLGPPVRHVHAVVGWFQAQCPPGDEGEGADGEGQLARLEAAASRLPGAVDILAAPGSGGCVYAESAGASAYFLPVVWRGAQKLIPEHVCWSQPAGAL
uniref:Dymeclin n=1 Tax=Alexandrium monilatum TaxID=311494 RepID=A0A7S4RKM5_9DINO